MLTRISADGKVKAANRGNDAALFWTGGWAYCCSVSLRLDGYQTASQREISPAGNKPGAIPQQGCRLYQFIKRCTL